MGWGGVMGSSTGMLFMCSFEASGSCGIYPLLLLLREEHKDNKDSLSPLHYPMMLVLIWLSACFATLT